jgi:DNA-binding NtrC family response regulator
MLGADLADLVGDLRPELPVVLMTGLNEPPDFFNSRHAARRAVFQKPIDFVELSRRLRKFLDKPNGLAHRKSAALRQSIPYLS